MSRGRKFHRYLAYAILGLGAIEFLLAGYGVFKAVPEAGTTYVFESSKYNAHRGLGDVLIVVAAAVLVLAFFTKRRVKLSAGLLGLMALQLLLAVVATKTQTIAALHPLGGVAVLAVAYYLTRPDPGDEVSARARVEVEKAQERLEQVREALDQRSGEGG
jgi:uncharacterized protein (TIGR04206 family)